MINIEEIKQLRQETGVSIGECKKALEEANGNSDKAKEILRKRGVELAGKKVEREAKNGRIECYIHSTEKLGVILDIRCESDFVARSKEFKELAHSLALHIAGMNPSYVKSEDIPDELLEREKEIYKAQLVKTEKPENIVQGIIEGKLKKYKEGISLLTQPFVKNQSQTVQELVNEHIVKLGENIVVKKFVRYEI